MKKKVIWWGLVVAAVLIFLGVMLRIKQGEDGLKITMGRDTTRARGPLRGDGTVDYVEALNERYGKGLTPANNAAAGMFEVFGPEFIMPPEVAEAAAKWMGVKVPAEGGEYFVELGSYLKKRMTLQELYAQGDEKIGAIVDAVQDGPWKAAEYPAVVEWLRHEDGVLKRFAEAAGRDRYYVPFERRGDAALLFGTFIEALGGVREGSKALTTRGMMGVDAGDVEGAFADAMVNTRVGRLLMHGPTMMHYLVGMSVMGESGKLMSAILEKGGLSAARAAVMRKQWEMLGTIPDGTEQLDLYERFACLDILTQWSRYGADLTASGGITPRGARAGAFSFGVFPVHFDALLKVANEWSDRAVAAVREPRFSVRDKALQQIVDDSKAKGAASGMMRSEKIMESWVSSYVPDWRGAFRLRTALEEQIDLVDVGLRFEERFGDEKVVTRAEVKAFAKTLPMNRFTEGAVEWRVEGEYLVLTSVGVAAEPGLGSARRYDREVRVRAVIK